MTTRWAVREDWHHVLGLVGGVKPVSRYIYYRWRWLARLNIWLPHPPLYGLWIPPKMVLLGKITEKDKHERASAVQRKRCEAAHRSDPGGWLTASYTAHLALNAALNAALERQLPCNRKKGSE